MYVKMVRKGNIKLTVSVNENILKGFKRLCEAEGWKLGRQLEKYMEDVVRNR